MNGHYVGIIAMAERLHRRAMELLDAELAQRGVGDLNATQAMILLQMGREQMTVSELTLRGCYQGTNVSYNLKRLTESGYVVQERSGWDRRVINVRVSDKGAALLEHLERFYVGLDAELANSGLNPAVLAGCEGELVRLERLSAGWLSGPDRESFSAGRVSGAGRSVRASAATVVALSDRRQVA
ncbi:MAG TPA: winged helix DNA-binding protein [Microvirga sp.]|jgi:DNA-binding MarR family transcriptional regulator|nr:winged helix DNA-binding protein [Microvirga sp.]